VVRKKRGEREWLFHPRSKLAYSTESSFLLRSGLSRERLQAETLAARRKRSWDSRMGEDKNHLQVYKENVPSWQRACNGGFPKQAQGSINLGQRRGPSVGQDPTSTEDFTLLENNENESGNLERGQR